MTSETRWTTLSVPRGGVARGGVALAGRLRLPGIAERRRSAAPCEWESEGGAPAAPADADKIPG